MPPEFLVCAMHTLRTCGLFTLANGIMSGIMSGSSESGPSPVKKLKQSALTFHTTTQLALSPGHSQILFCSCGEKLGEGLRSLLCHRPEMVDTVSTNRDHITYLPCLPFPARDVAMIPGLLLIFLHSCEIKFGSGLGDEATT